MNMKIKSIGAGVAFALVGAAGSASAAVYNYDQYITGVDLGTSILAILDVVQDGNDIDFTLTNTGAAGTSSWVDYLKFNYMGSETSFNVTDDVDEWTVSVGPTTGNGVDASLTFDFNADISPNGSANGLGPSDTTTWSLLGVDLADFKFLNPNSLIHIGGLANDGSTKYSASSGGGGGNFEVVPVPAALPLLLTGLGAFGFLRRRSRKTA